MGMQPKIRNRKKKGLRSCLTGAPLDPIYEHFTPLEEYMSETILKHAHIHEDEESMSTTKPGSLFQIITDNPSSHPEFLHRRTHPKRLLLSPLPTTGEGRWANGESPPLGKRKDVSIGNDSNSSINTASTSSLTVSLVDEEEDFSNESTMTDIIEHATEVVTGKFNGNFEFEEKSTGRRQVARRSSMPIMPIRQESIKNLNFSTEELDHVQVDKFGIPIVQHTDECTRRRRRHGRRHSEEDARKVARSVSFDLPLEVDERKEEFSDMIQVDKFGIPIPQTGRRRRKERRSSMPTAPTTAKPKGKRRGRRPSPPILMNTSTASAMRFFPEELQIKSHQCVASSINGAPIRPERVPSIDSFGSQHGKIFDAAQPNASFDCPMCKNAINNSTNNKLLDNVLKSGKRDQTDGCGSDMSVNSFQQKDGEWWL